MKEMKEIMKEERLRIELKVFFFFFVSFDFDFDFNFCGWCLSERRELGAMRSRVLYNSSSKSLTA